MKIANYKQKLQQFREKHTKHTANKMILPTIAEADLKKYFANIKPPTMTLKEIDASFNRIDYNNPFNLKQ